MHAFQLTKTMETVSSMAARTPSLTIAAPPPSSRSSSRSSGIASTRTISAALFAAPSSPGALRQHRRAPKSSFASIANCDSGSSSRRRRGVVTAQAKSEDAEGVGAAGVGAIGGGLVANPVVWWSLYTLKSTGCGLPPGPGGSIGAIEGVSYLAVLGVIAWSLYTKVKTGSGLPQGPFGLLGAVEGVSYLSLLAIAVVFGLQALDFGFIPGPLPGKECFG